MRIEYLVIMPEVERTKKREKELAEKASSFADSTRERVDYFALPCLATASCLRLSSSGSAK